MKIKFYIILLFLTMLSLKNFATHIVGGEIFYDCLGGNNYRITLKLYRDCNPGNAAYDDPATLFIFNSAGTFLDSLCIHFPGAVQLPATLNNPCLTVPSNVCVEEAVYKAVVNLPPIAGGYDITYQRCCRNGTILNITTPGNVGATYMAHIPYPGLAVCNNSSPRYNHFPPICLCVGVPLNFDHSASDPNGDSLYYQLCDPYTGLDANCPILGPQAISPCPQIVSPPSYSFVPWIAPYNGASPMSSSPALAINHTTGLMTGTPNMIGQFVVAVCVSEYRNGVLLDVNKRDFQFNVVNCSSPVASIPVQQPFCFGSASHFTQNSINAFSYHWDFGDPGTILDTSNVLSPNWTYASIGTYTVTLIINPGTLCADTASITVTVNPLPTMTSPNTATICSGGTVSIPLTSSLASTYKWVATNNPNTTGESLTPQTGSPLSNTIINNSTLVQTVTYTVTPTSTPGCAGTPQTVTVTVNPGPAMTSPASATICNGGTVNIPLTGSSTSTYTWIASDNTNTTGESLITQIGSPLNNTITNSSTSLQIVTYTVTPTSTPQGCLGIPQTVNVTVIPIPTMTSVTTATICSGSTVSIPLTSNVTSTYSWVATDNLNTTGESLFPQAGTPLSNLITNNSAVVQTVTYTVTPTSSPQGCSGTPQTVTVTVNPGPTMTSPNSATICSGGTVSIPLTSNNTSTYTWIAANNPNTTGESTSLQSGSPLSNTIINNTSSVQTVTYVVTPISSPEGCVGTPQTVTVTVNPLPTMTSPVTATICNGGTVSIPLTSNNVSAYSWIATDNPNTTGESLIPQVGSPLNNTITNNATTIQTVNYTITPTSNPEGCVGTPQTVVVTILPTPTMTSVSGATICTGGTVNIPLNSNVTSTFTWIATDNLNTTGESVTPQTVSPLNNTITNNTSSVQTVTYTVTPTSSPDGCAGTPQILNVIVNPLPTMTSPVSATICSGWRLSIPLTSNNTSTFSWVATNNPNTTGESTTPQTGSPINDSIFNNTISVQTIIYTVTPTSNPEGCIGTPQTLTVTANPAANMTSPSSATICTGGTVNIPLTSNYPSPYTWIAADNVNTTGESTTLQVGSPLTNTIINTSTTIQSVIYTVTPIYFNGLCPGIPQSLPVMVIPTPIVTNPISATVCSGSTVSIPLTSNVSSTYSWVATNNPNTTGESLTPQTGSPLSNTLTNITSSVETVSYTVTPTSNPDGCAGTPQILSVTVNPPPSMTSPNSATICTGGVVNLALTSNNTSTFTWIATNNPNTTGESTTTHTGNSITDTIINNTSSAETVTYTVTPTSSPEGCVGTPQTITITVNPGLIMTNLNAATICNGGTVSIPLTASSSATFTWIATDNLNTTGESTTLQSGSPLTDVITNNSNSVQSVIYTVTPTSNPAGCVGTPQTITVSVIPTPTITSPVTDSICSGGTAIIPLTSNVTSTYSWIATDNPNTTGESTAAQSGTPLSNTITNSTTLIQTVSYTVTPTSSPDGCTGTPQTITVTLYPKFSADFDFVKVPCTNQITFYDSSAVAPVSWLWHFADGDSSFLQNPTHTYAAIGTYNVQLITSTINGCRDTVVVQVNLAATIPVTISPNITICKGDHTQLNATGGVAYHWVPATSLSNAAISNPVASPDTTTTYTVAIVTVDMFGDTCLQNLTTTVFVIDPSLYSIFASTDKDTLIQGQSTTIHATTNPASTVTWTPAIGLSDPHSLNPTATPQITTTYTVSILDSLGCPKTATIKIYVESRKCNADDVFVPNTFTPNGDGYNDILYVRGNEIKYLVFSVYNRWGELVFETKDITKGWDGMYKGVKAAPDVFAWYFTARCFDGDEMKKQGNVTLMR